MEKESSNAAMTLETVQKYYGEKLKTSQDLQTNACCTAESIPVHLRPYLKNIHDEVMEKFYGCGSPIPHGVKGIFAVDLGSGSGRDSYLLSQLVGPSGQVVGVDMTEQQLSVAKKHVGYQTEKFGYKKPNVEFRQGYIEDLNTVGLKDNSVDLVVSNCVINLSPNKKQVFAEIFRILKPGGELYFSDVFANRRIPQHLAEDPVLLGECLGGAMYTEDFRRMLFSLGIKDYRVMSGAPITIQNPEIETRAGGIQWSSITYRIFKIPLEDKCEDFGQMAIYKGGIEHCPELFKLDDHHIFEKGKPMSVCGNTADMISKSRFGKHFEVMGTKDHHYGIFDCAPLGAALSAQTVGACC